MREYALRVLLHYCILLCYYKILYNYVSRYTYQIMNFTRIKISIRYAYKLNELILERKVCRSNALKDK